MLPPQPIADRVAVEALPHRRQRRLERRAVRVGHPPRRPAARAGVTFTSTPHGGSAVRNAFRSLEHLLRVLVRHDAAADDRRRLRQHLVRRPLDRARLLRDHRHRRPPPRLFVGVAAPPPSRSLTPGRMPRSLRHLASSNGSLRTPPAPSPSAAGPGRRSRGSAAGRCPSTAGRGSTFSAMAASASAPPAMPLWTGIFAGRTST